MKHLILLLALALVLVGCETPQQIAESRFPNATDIKEYNHSDGSINGMSFTTIIDGKARRIFMDYGTNQSVCLEGCNGSDYEPGSEKTKEEVLSELTEEQKKALGYE